MYDGRLGTNGLPIQNKKIISNYLGSWEGERWKVRKR